jgi:DNA-directed RNA polymerase specialized sigma24 family protein
MREKKGLSMLPSPRKGLFLDLHNTCDEVLLLLAREAHLKPAGDELTCRYWQRFRIICWQWCAARRLTSWDLEDAQQQAYFWIQEAIRAYDVGQLCRPGGSSFATFAQRIFRLRLMDFGRSLQRNNQRYSRAALATRYAKEFVVDRRIAFAGQPEDLHRRLPAVLGLLDPPTRSLWHEMCAGKRLCDLAEDRGVSYRTLKRRWRKLRHHLALALHISASQSESA